MENIIPAENQISPEPVYDVYTSMHTNFLSFLVELHQEESLSKKVIDKIYGCVKSKILDPIINMIPNEKEKDEINEAYNSLSTYYKFDKALKNTSHFVQPNQVVVSERIDNVFIQGCPAFGVIKDSIASISITQQIKAVLELPSILEKTLDNMRNIQKSQNVKNFIQGLVWKNIISEFKENEIVIPLHLFVDDFEPDNALGANSGNNKITGFYFNIPVFPQHLLSSPEYIFVAQLCLSKLKDADINSCLFPLMNELKSLENEGDFVSNLAL